MKESNGDLDGGLVRPSAILTALHRSPAPYVLGSLTIFSPLIDGGTTHLPVLIIRLALLAALTAWILLSMRSGVITVYRNPLFLPIALFLGWAALSLVLSPYTAVSLQWGISLLSYATLLILVIHLLSSSWQVRGVVAVVLAMGLFEAGVGIYQYLWLNHPRATGTFFNPNFFATYEVAVFSVAVGLLCFNQRSQAGQWVREGGQRAGTPPAQWEKAVLWVTAGLSGLAFVLAQSRGALVACIAAVSCVGLYRFGKPFLAFLLLSLLLVSFIPNPLQHRILTLGAGDPYAYTRLDIWKNSFQRVAEHPWGVGMGVYKYTSFQYRFPIENAIARYAKRAESAHNEYIQMAVELGLAGMAIFLAGVGFLGREIRKTLTGELEPWERGLVIGCTGGLLGMLVHAGVDSVFHEPALVMLIVLFVGLILVLQRLRGAERAVVWTIPFPYHPARVALVGVLAFLLTFIMIRPVAAWYAFEKGEREMTEGKMDRALASFQWATLIDPGTSAYHDAVAFTEARLFQRTGDVGWAKRAISELQIGLELNPLDGRLANRVGSLYALLAQREAAEPERAAMTEQAVSAFEQAVRLDPYSPFNYFELGKLRWQQGRVDEAEAWFRQATRFEPNFLPARVHLAELYLKAGRRETAVSEYEEILKIKERYKGRVLNSLERQFLEVEDEHLNRTLPAGVSS
jgi:tetratricopeptide (TPR) repeat protein